MTIHLDKILWMFFIFSAGFLGFSYLRKAVICYLFTFEFRQKDKLFRLSGSVVNPYSKETSDLAVFIVNQMVDHLEKNKKQIRQHALDEVAILLKIQFHVPYPPDSPVFIMAMSAVQHAFFMYHGTWIDMKRSDKQNHFEYGAIGLSGLGSEVFIFMSILNHGTAKSYDYRDHISDL